MSVSVSRKGFERVVVVDDDPDPLYLEQEEFEQELASYQRGEWGFIGVAARVELLIPMGVQGGGIAHVVQSPGLWGVEDSSGESYLNEIFVEESQTLETMLKELCIEVTD